MKKFLDVVHPDVVRAFAVGLPPRGGEAVPLAASLGRVLAERVVSREPLPPFRRSTMDGYAVRAADVAGASPSSPAYLRCAGEVFIGHPAGFDIGPGIVARIATGAMLPDSADAVVMVEQTREIPGELVEIGSAAAPGENVVGVGEDLEPGETVLEAGTIIRPQEVGILAGLGVVSVPVRRRVRVGILSTGDELVEPAVQPGPGQVRNVNQYSLLAHVLALGGEPTLLGLARDDADEIVTRVTAGLAAADVILVSGGSSVGTRDLTAGIIDRLGPPGVLFHGVSVRPGKPTIVGMAGEKVIFGLPGHPISAMVAFLSFVAPALRAMAGASPSDAGPSVRAVLEDNVPSRPGREDYVQVSLRAAGTQLAARPLFRKSGMVTSMVGADGMIVIPHAAEGLETGEEVEVLLYPRVLR
jgi:molybdopterin molybdotransferase